MLLMYLSRRMAPEMRVVLGVSRSCPPAVHHALDKAVFVRVVLLGEPSQKQFDNRRVNKNVVSGI